MRILRRLAPLLFLLAVAACAGNGDDFDFDTCGVRPRYTLPVNFTLGVPIVQASIGGQPARFILDTGATNVTLTDAAARRLELGTDARRIITSQGVGGQVRSFAGNLRDFRIGPMLIPDHQVQLVPNLPGSSEPNGVDGLFGVSVLSVFEVELNLRHQLVTLYAGRLCPETVTPPWNFGYSTINAEASERGRFLIPVELDGHKLTALLDTGAAVTVVARDVAALLGATDEVLASSPQGRLLGVGATAPAAALYGFRQIRIGDETFANPQMLVSLRVAPNIDMVLGSNFLANHRIWLSYARKRVYIEYSRPPARS